MLTKIGNRIVVIGTPTAAVQMFFRPAPATSLRASGRRIVVIKDNESVGGKVNRLSVPTCR